MVRMVVNRAVAVQSRWRTDFSRRARVSSGCCGAGVRVVVVAGDGVEESIDIGNLAFKGGDRGVRLHHLGGDVGLQLRHHCLFVRNLRILGSDFGGYRIFFGFQAAGGGIFDAVQKIGCGFEEASGGGSAERGCERGEIGVRGVRERRGIDGKLAGIVDGDSEIGECRGGTSVAVAGELLEDVRQSADVLSPSSAPPPLP